MQAAPTGFSAIVAPDGDVVTRTDIGEQAVRQGTVELRDGKTIYVRVGRWPMLTIAVLLLVGAQLLARRRRGDGPLAVEEPARRDEPSTLDERSDLDEHGDRAVVDELDGHVGAETSRGDRRAELP
jgi:hypothetical protein